MKERSINIVSSKLKLDRLYYKNQPRLHIISKGFSEFDPHTHHQFNSSVKLLQGNNEKQKQSVYNLPRVNFKGQQEVRRNNVRIKTSYYPSAQKSQEKQRKNKRAGTIYINKNKEQKTKKKIEGVNKVEELFATQIQKLIECRLIRKDQQSYIIPAAKFISILEHLLELLTLRMPKNFKHLHTVSSQVQSLPKIDPYKTSMTQLDPSASNISEPASRAEHLSEEQVCDQMISTKIKEADLIEDDLRRKEEYLKELNRVIYQQQAIRQQLSKQLMKMLNDQQLVSSLKEKGFLQQKDAYAYEKKCKQYLDAQKYMFDYANYLENNELAISFDFDEGIFKEEKIKILNRMSQVMQFLESSRDQSHGALKAKLFIQDLDSFHLDKERQILKVCHLKTHAIKCFIRNTRCWLKNWKFKLDVLHHFKQLFAINSHKINCWLAELKLFTKKDPQMAPFSELVEEIECVFKEMVEYFTLGNSFY